MSPAEIQLTHAAFLLKTTRSGLWKFPGLPDIGWVSGLFDVGNDGEEPVGSVDAFQFGDTLIGERVIETVE